MGRKLLGSVVLPFLKIGRTVAVFHTVGISESFMELSKMWHRGIHNVDAQFIRS